MRVGMAVSPGEDVFGALKLRLGLRAECGGVGWQEQPTTGRPWVGLAGRGQVAFRRAEGTLRSAASGRAVEGQRPDSAPRGGVRGRDILCFVSGT